MLVTSIFSFSHNVFYPTQNKFQFFSHIYFVVCKCFQFGPVLKKLSFGKELIILLSLTLLGLFFYGQYSSKISSYILSRLISDLHRIISRDILTNKSFEIATSGFFFYEKVSVLKIVSLTLCISIPSFRGA